MDHKEKLTELHQESVEKLDEFIKTKDPVKEEAHEQVHAARAEWINAWNKMMEALLVLERLEI